MPPASSRILAFDWLRGLAVLVMVETHALVFLRPDLREAMWVSKLDFINGLVAPSFIFAAGFSLAFVQVRTALSTRQQMSRAARFRRTLRRICEVLAVGALVNFIWFHQLIWLLRLDILPCIGVSLLIALPLMAGLAARPTVLATSLLVLAAGVFAVAPLFEHVTGPWANVLNRSGSLHPVFPLVPWAGYVFLGGAVGALTASQTRVFVQRFLFGMGIFAAAIWSLGPWFMKVYPPHAYAVSDPANHALRLVCVCALLLALLALENWMPPEWRTKAPVRFVELFGTTSLAAYFFHEMILFMQIRGHSLAGRFRDQCSWAEFVPLLIFVWAATAVCVKGADLAYPHWERLIGANKRQP